ncbi:MAG: ketopantoate reductase C-terminal domain-containing protein [Lachnospiraceae bacterium]|nr:ketopantoate reductase C-terminal domain-containing protein [Lachnospiraceae bacterium]
MIQGCAERNIITNEETRRSENSRLVSLFVNLSINTFTAITQMPIGYMLKNEDAWHFARRPICEAVEVAESGFFVSVPDRAVIYGGWIILIFIFRKEFWMYCI